MLDLLRRHAKSWAIKVPIAAIIISFAFFFGYNAMRKASKGINRGIHVASVNGKPVSEAEYQYFLDLNYEQLRKSFGGAEVPDFVADMAKNTTMRQVLSREVMIDQADELGIVIPDVELADTIMKIQTMMQGGQFDPLFYEQRYLPHFKDRYGLDYEKFMRRDLELSSFSKLFEGIGGPSQKAEASTSGSAWTFGVIEIDPGKADVAEEIIQMPAKGWNGKLKQHKLEEKKTGPITLSQRKQLAGGKLSMKELETIFGLTDDKPVLEKPIKHEDKIYVIRLIEKKKSDKAEGPEDSMDFFRAWMSKLLATTKIETYLDKEKQ